MEQIKNDFIKFVKDVEFPCIGAKAAVNKQLLSIIVCKDMNSEAEDLLILSNLYKFIGNWHHTKQLVQSFVVIFQNTTPFSEIEFECSLWNRLQALHNLDSQWHAWDERVSSDVTDPNFSFSLGNTAFFIIGLHPNSSRVARQFHYPAIIFNLHEQFQLLRNMGSFNRMRDKIRQRDFDFTGSINPMVRDFGDFSEALQYSGRNIPKEHRCPFTINKKSR